MGVPDIAIVVSPRGWAERLHRFIADHGGARVRARVLDAREAVDHPYAVLVVEDLTSFLTPRLLDEVHHRGRRVLGVFEPAEPWGRQRLEELGVDETLRADTPPEEFLRTIESLAAGIDLDREIAALVDDPAPAEPGGDSSQRRGLVTAVGGPSGGPGVSEIAIGLATCLDDGTSAAVLVDGDAAAPCLAQRLGLGLHPNVRTAIDAVEHRTGTLGGALQPLPRGPAVLAGLADRREIHHVRPTELLAVVDELAARHRHVVVDVGCRLDDRGTSGGEAGPGLASSLIANADRIVGVGAPTPVGVARLLAWTADVRGLASLTPLHLVVNRAPGGRFKRGELAEEVQRTVGVASLTLVPADRRVEQAAWDGTTVGSGPFLRAVADLAGELARVASGATSGAAEEVGA